MNKSAFSFNRPGTQPDWCETFYGKSQVTEKTSQELFQQTLNNSPKWFTWALTLRNLVVKPLGLKTEFEGQGHLLTRLPVINNEPDVFETGIDDKHLTFTIELNQDDRNVYLTTNIWFNSFLGKVYLAMILPFHLLIVKQMISQVARPVSRINGSFDEARSNG